MASTISKSPSLPIRQLRFRFYLADPEVAPRKVRGFAPEPAGDKAPDPYCLSEKKSSEISEFGRKQFFSEEKNQKTFAPALAGKVEVMTDMLGGASKDKSLLALFFRKELLP
jgi:hypothetical protein